MNSDEILTKIARIEKELSELKIGLTRREIDSRTTGHQLEELKVGDRVKILNPRKGQRDQGTISRIGKETNYVTVDTKTGKVVRHRSNVSIIRK